MFLNDTACNLASLNLMKFVDADGEFDAEAYRYAARLTITAQEILVDNASYPTPQIEENSHRFRPLGLGYANLGALLMSRGLAYDSDEGRNLRRGPHRDHARRGVPQSAIIARDHGGPFHDYTRSTRRRSCASSASTATRPTRSPTTGVPADLLEATPTGLRRGARARQAARLPQRAGDRARAHRDDRLHDGLRYDRRRAGHRAHQVQEAGRRGLPQDRQPDRPGRAAQARLRRRRRSRRSSTTSTSARRSRARRTSSRSTCRSSTARSSRPTASGPSTTWATSG